MNLTAARTKLLNMMQGSPLPYYGDFAKALAGRMSDDMVPEGVLLAVSLLGSDLQRGVNGYTGEAITTKLARLDASMYRILGAIALKDIVEALSEADAAEFQRVRDEINQELLARAG